MPDSSLGRYSLLREIARGGMGTVYEATDTVLQRRVALKVLHDSQGDPHVLERLHREAAIAAQLQHPNIVVVHEVGMVRDGTGRTHHFIAMDYVEGSTLEKILAEKRTPRRELLRMLETVARAVGYAHTRGVVHRDLKPANVLVDAEGRVVLTDFGLAHAEFFHTRLTQSRTVIGTPLYMAPEQVEGKARDVDGRTDVYALGVVLYEILVGRPPFQSPTPAKLYEQIRFGEPKRPRSLERAIEPDLEIICLKALEKDRLQRYDTATAFADDLRRFLAGEPIRGRPSTLFYRLGKRLAKRKAVTIAIASSVLLVGILATVLPMLFRKEARLQESRAQLTETQQKFLAQMRMTSDAYLGAALELRRTGNVAAMRKFAEKAEQSCRDVIAEMPALGEPHYRLGRIDRALMRDADALREQNLALERDPTYGPAIYERIVLTARLYRKRVDVLMEQAWREEGGRIAGEGKGAVEGGADIRKPVREEVARKDPQARELRERLEEDQRLLSDVGDGEAACARGLVAWVVGNTEAARELLASAVEKAPTLEEGYESLATLELEADRYEESVRWWTAGLKQDPGYLPHWTGLGRTRSRWAYAKTRRGEDGAADFQQAIDACGEALRRDPAWTEAWKIRGNTRSIWSIALQDEGKDPTPLLEEAIRDLDEVVRRSPEDDEGWWLRGGARVNLANFLGNRGRDPGSLWQDAIRDFDEALSRNRERPKTWTWRGMARMNSGIQEERRKADPTTLYGEAVRDFDEALKREPGDEEAWMMRGHARLWWGLYRERRGEDPRELYTLALSDYDEALKRSDKSDELWLARGRARMMLAGQAQRWKVDPTRIFEQAIADLEEARKLNRKREETLTKLGGVRCDLGMCMAGRGEDPTSLYREAVENLREAAKLNGSSPDARQFLGNVYANWAIYKASHGLDAAVECRSALEAYEEALRLDSQRAGTLEHMMSHCREYLRSRNP